MTPEELPLYLAGIRDRVGREGPSKAAYAMARAFHAEVSGVELVKYSHTRYTTTPAPPGGPPALIGGHLKRSLRLYAAVSTGAYTARSKVIPQIVYARIQELGGTVVAHGGFLRWRGPVTAKNKAGVYFASSITLPARPYMRPVHRRMVQDGRFRQAAIRAIRGLVAGG